MSTDAPDRPLEAEELRRWRYTEAKKLGLPRRAAARFADEGLSPRDLEELVGKGCPPLVALDILLP